MCDTDQPTAIKRHVLSIQSHTVYGYVGNKSAVFPLQLLGFNVSNINSVQFSNHTGSIYPNGFKGQILTGQQLNDIVTGLELNNLLKKFDTLLTGYIGNVSFLHQIISLVAKLKEIHGDKFTYVCDPVLGDHGKLYVPKELVQVYIDQVLPTVSVLTPNHFELELLSGAKIGNIHELQTAMQGLHRKGVGTIFVTSTDMVIDCKEMMLGESSGLGREYFVASTVELQKAGKLLVASFPKIDMYFTGTGDLVAALLLAWTTIYRDDLCLAVKKSLCCMQSVLQRTYGDYISGNNPEKELSLVESRFDILEPRLSNAVDVRIVNITERLLS